jgi:putative glutamine transport system substrate-binding protein
MTTRLILILFLCVTHLALAQLKGDTYAQAQQTKTATWIITQSNSPGLAETNAAGKPEGLCFDIMNAFAAYVKTKTGITVTMKYQTENANDFTAYLKQVKDAKGGVFGVSNTTITAQRKQAYNFSPPYIKNISMILSHPSVPELAQIDKIATTFAGFKAITVKGSTNEARILNIKAKYFPGLVIEYVSSFSQVIDRVASDPKTFCDMDFTYYLKGLQSGKKTKRHAVGDKPDEEFGILMPLSNDWSPLMTEFMNSFTASSDYNKVVTKHLGQSVLQFIKKS